MQNIKNYIQNCVLWVFMSTNNIGFGRELMDFNHHHSLLSFWSSACTQKGSACGFKPYQWQQFTNPCFLDYFQLVPNQSIILTLEGQLYCYSHNPERQGGKPLLPILKTLVPCGLGLNPQTSTHEADTLPTRPPWRNIRKNIKRKWNIFF